MQIPPLPVNARAARMNSEVERVVNWLIRARDTTRERLHLGGRAAQYDDARYEFVGGPSDELRKKHYDKSLRLLWKAEAALPWSTFRDLSTAEHAALREPEMRVLAERDMTNEEKQFRSRISTTDFRARLDREYTLEQKRAVVAVLTAIGHGEAYAWLVSASLLSEVRSTGAKAALTLQILEEAKHFVVMRELVQAFGVGAPRQSAWEYLLLERTLKSDGIDKLFGMNVLVESIALGIFGALSTLPGLEVLRLFHLDESRHTALPANYFKEFPMSARQKRSALGRWRRLQLSLPTLPLIMLLEPDLAVLGIDAFDLAGSVMRKVTQLSQRAGFLNAEQANGQTAFFNRVFNLYCRATRPNHVDRDFMAADTTRGQAELAVERAIFEPNARL